MEDDWIEGVIVLKDTDPMPYALVGSTNEQNAVAIGRMFPERLIEAYSNGIFPWDTIEDDVVTWHSPHPRYILEPKNFYTSKSLKKSMRRYEVRHDTNFEAVVRNCQSVERWYWVDEKQPDGSDKKVRKKFGTWITDAFVENYVALHKMGFSHSIETYYGGELVGGLFGFGIGSVFCGDSQFQLKRDASKVALAHLVEMYSPIGGFIDCQDETEHMISLGANPISIYKYLSNLTELRERVNPWDSL